MCDRRSPTVSRSLIESRDRHHESIELQRRITPSAPVRPTRYMGTLRIALLRQIRFVPRMDLRGMKLMWNDQLDAKLLRLRREGLSFAEVAERMGLSRNTVLGRAQRLAGKKFPSQTARSELRRRANDARSRQLAAKEKVTSRKLKKDLARGVPRDVAVRTALDLGATPKLVAGIIGVSSQRVCQIIRES